MNSIENIVITSDAFADNGTIPVDNTAYEKNISPSLKLSKLSDRGKSIAIIMDDIDHPLFGVFNHWVIWNIPPSPIILENIPKGAYPSTPKGAVQGRGYGRNKYKGPRPPFGSHRYQFNVYVLDYKLDLSTSSRKKDVLKAMEGHILQYGKIIGKYR